MTEQVGGKVFGQGTFGTVFGLPRIPCSNETLADVSGLNEVSKVFSSQRAALKEFSVNTRLQPLLGDDFTEVNKYLVLPKKVCDINLAEVQDEDVYTDEEWGTYKGKDMWQIMFEEPASVPWQVVYDEADTSLLDITRNIANVDDFRSFVCKLLNVCKGIQLLQKHGLIHGDIKSGNAVSMDGVFKLIDIGDINSMADITVMINRMPTSFEYIAWPAIVAWLSYFDRDVAYDIEEDGVKDMFYNADGMKEMTNDGIRYLYSASADFNSDSIINYIPFMSVINIFDTKGLEEEDIALIHEVNVSIMGEKLFGYPGFTRTFYKDSVFLEALQGDETLPLIDTYNHLINSYGSDEEAKVDILKRVDIYSLGIILVGALTRLFKSNSELSEEDREFVVKFVRIVRECCVQRDRSADINEITKMWVDAVGGVVAVPVVEDVEEAGAVEEPEEVEEPVVAGAEGGSETPTEPDDVKLDFNDTTPTKEQTSTTSPENYEPTEEESSWFGAMKSKFNKYRASLREKRVSSTKGGKKSRKHRRTINKKRIQKRKQKQTRKHKSKKN